MRPLFFASGQFKKRTYSNVSLKIASVSGGAFITAVSGSIPFDSFRNRKLTINSTADSALKLVGYIKQAGTTETLDTELVVNGNMETGVTPSSWSASTATLSGVADERTGGTGVKSLGVARNGNNSPAATQNVTTIIGALYRLDSWLKNIDLISIRAALRDASSNVEWGTTAIRSATTWALETARMSAKDIDGRIRLIGDGTGKADGTKGLFDDVSCKRVLTPDNTGCIIVSSPGGSTQSWFSNGGIDENSVTFTLTIE